MCSVRIDSCIKIAIVFFHLSQKEIKKSVLRKTMSCTLTLYEKQHANLLQYWKCYLPLVENMDFPLLFFFIVLEKYCKKWNKDVALINKSRKNLIILTRNYNCMRFFTAAETFLSQDLPTRSRAGGHS